MVLMKQITALLIAASFLVSSEAFAGNSRKNLLDNSQESQESKNIPSSRVRVHKRSPQNPSNAFVQELGNEILSSLKKGLKNQGKELKQQFKTDALERGFSGISKTKKEFLDLLTQEDRKIVKDFEKRGRWTPEAVQNCLGYKNNPKLILDIIRFLTPSEK